ncbi:MAG: cyanophycin synthetase, partial [Thermoguttaceae bacterium]
TKSIVAAAIARTIPVRRLNTGSLVQFGYGRKQRRIQAAETERTSAIAESIAQDKEITRLLLRSAGVPVCEGRPVLNAEDAWKAALEIGLPVVIKPQDGNQGRGVATNLTTREQVLAAFHAAKQESDEVLLEKFAPGHDYRLLIVAGKVIAAARREPAQVIGDGEHSVAELVDIANADPRRGDHHATVLSKIKLDQISLAVLAEQGFAPDSLPPNGAVVLIRRNGNLSTGGTAIDVTEYVHPEVAARAIDAATIVGLDIAGIDIIAQDVSRPLEEQGGVIVEVNAAPGLRMHLEPSVGISRPVGEAIIDQLYPQGENGRIPIAAVSGINGKTTTTRFIAHLLKGDGKTVGMTCTDGIYIGERRIDNGDCSGPKSAQSVLFNPTVDAAVFETARGGILREGLAFDFCDVAVVTNIGEGDHLGISEINTPEDLAKVKRCIVDVVSTHGYAVLNAADPLVANMAAYCAGNVLFFALQADNPIIVRHRSLGGRAVFVREGQIVFADAGHEQILMPVAEVPITLDGKIKFHLENTLAATAAAWCLGTPLDDIRQRALTFTADMVKTPGRFNVMEVEGATVIVDYGHNVHSLSAVIEVIEKFPHKHRTTVYSTAGDRRDEDMIRQGELLGNHFDRVILYEDHYRRGRAEGEIIALFRKGVQSGSRAKEIIEISGATKAAETGLKIVQPGELLLLQADKIDETMDWIRSYLVALDEQKTAAEEAIEEAVAESTSPVEHAAAKDEAAPQTVPTQFLDETPEVAKA